METIELTRIKPMEADQVVTKIIEVVCKIHGVTLGEMRLPSRQQHIKHPRHLCMYLIRKYTRYPLTYIGLYFNRHHATVINALIKIEDGIRFDAEIRKDFNKAKDRFENYHVIQSRLNIFEALLNERVNDEVDRGKWLNRYVIAN